MINDKPYSFWGLVAVVLFAIVFLGSITSNVLLNKSVDIQRDSTAYWRGKYDSASKETYLGLIFDHAIRHGGGKIFFPSDTTELPYIVPKNDSCQIWKHGYDSLVKATSIVNAKVIGPIRIYNLPKPHVEDTAMYQVIFK